MTSYKVKYRKGAQKFIKSNKRVGLQFFQAFEEIKNDGDFNNYDIKRFHDKTYKDIFRLRIGKYRAIFRLVDDELILLVITMGSSACSYK